MGPVQNALKTTVWLLRSCALQWWWLASMTQ